MDDHIEDVSRPNAVHVDLDAIRSNARGLRLLVGSQCMVFATLKSDAYGFGVPSVAAALDPLVDGFAVADVRSAVTIRGVGTTQRILLFGGPSLSEPYLRAVETYDLIPTVFDREGVAFLAQHTRKRIDVFIKVNVGLERFGIYPDEAIPFAEMLREHSNLRLGGIYTHMHVPSEPQVGPYLRWQFERFEAMLNGLAAVGIDVPVRMAAASAVLGLTRSTMSLNAVDPGNLLFGLTPPGVRQTPFVLRPALISITSELVHVRHVVRQADQEYIPFGIREGMRIGIIPIGRSDGFDLFRSGHVLVRGRLAPIVGEPSAEHSRIDLSDIPDASVGDEVVIVGAQGPGTITAADVMEFQGTKRESLLVVSVRSSIPRRYYGLPEDAEGPPEPSLADSHADG